MFNVGAGIKLYKVYSETFPQLLMSQNINLIMYE